MTDEEFLARLREAFAVEAQEHVQAMTAGVLELEKAIEPARRQSVIETTFREAHSLKGAARAVSRGDIESVCQAFEAVFSVWKKQPSAVGPEAFDTLNRAIDLVTRLLRQTDATSADRTEVTDMVRALNAIQEKQPATPEVAAFHETNESHGTYETHPTAASPVPETVRLPTAKMDALLRQAEELVALKLSAGQHTLDLRSLADEISSWRKEWARVREAVHHGLAGENAASLTRVGDFLEWNDRFMRAIEKRTVAMGRAAARDERSLGTRIDELLNDTKRLVMLPFSTLLDLFPKLVRDLAREQGKEIELIVTGREVEIDKRVLQEMKDPLIHLVRNSIDHGLEMPDGREAAGKPRAGTLTLAVSQRDGGKVEILICDDGRGIDLEMVKAAAVKGGGLTDAEARVLDQDETLDLIFRSGVSTSPIVTEISGRGLGMAIVREKVEQLGGRLTLETQKGQGTTFRLVLPVTLATFKGIQLRTGGQDFVVPTVSVEGIVRIRRTEIRMLENHETFSLDGRRIALARLDDILELPPRHAPPAEDVEVVVLGAGDERIGFAVEEVVRESEVLVKPLGKPLVRVRNIAGATVLGSGQVALILNTGDLLKSAVRRPGPSHLPSTERLKSPDVDRVRSILVADDSITSRMLLKNILESAGFSVTTAVDGTDALTALKTSAFDLLVSDVEMPRMDGFELTQKVRAESKLKDLPVVLVTALGSREHRERGIDVGASGYIVKSSFDQSDLLAVISKLI